MRKRKLIEETGSETDQWIRVLRREAEKGIVGEKCESLQWKERAFGAEMEV